ncbi:MAG: hypothetical protein ACREQ4_01435 [Candidatus Binataceae bacterium]
MAQPQEMQNDEQPLIVEQFTRAQYVWEIIQGILIVAGLGLLWLLEIIRDGCFALADRINWPIRPRKGRPFPPGPQRTRATLKARQ